jgi:hypothetical protein
MIDFKGRVGWRGSLTRITRRALVLDCPDLMPLRALQPPYDPVVMSWEKMIEGVSNEPPSTVAVVSAFVDGAPHPRVRRLIAAAALVPVVAVVPIDAAHAAGMQTLFEWGIADVADVEFEGTPREIVPRLSNVHAAPFKALLEPHLSRFVSMDALTLIRAAAGVVVDGGAAADLAVVFESGERTVAGWCRRAALPPPRRVFAWLRLLLALASLDAPGRTATQAASWAGYHDHSLRRATRKLLGGGVLPRPGLFATAATAFNAELRELRERAREVRRGAREA